MTTDLNIVGHMICRNEADVIEETIAEAFRWIDTLVVLDGQSNDGTYGILLRLASEYAIKGKALHVHSEQDRDDRWSNHTRTRLLELTAPHEPDWVFSVDADEIYHVKVASNIMAMSPVEAIHLAERAGANVVRSMVPQFWLTFDDLREGALMEDVTISVQKRRRWYTWGHMGTFIWKWNADHFYPELPSKRTPELPGLTWREWQRAAPVTTICKHYCFRSMAQAMKRSKERLERGGTYYFGKYAQNWLIDDELVDLHHLGDTEIWKTGENHLAVCRYLAGEHLLWKE